MSVTRVAIVGAGPMGRLHARTVSRLAGAKANCALTMIIDRHYGRAESLADEFGARASSDPAAVRSEVDAVIVCVSTAAHYSLASSFLEHDLDVLVEKPIAASIAEADELVALARTRGRILQVGHVEWYNQGWRAAARHAGVPTRIDVVRLNPPSRRGLDLDVVQDFMLHDLDWVTRWLGEEIVEVAGRGRCVVSPKLDEAEAELRFRSGCRVNLLASRVHTERRRSVRIQGSEGVAIGNLLTRSLDGAVATEKHGDETNGERPLDPLEMQWTRFLESVTSRREPEANGQAGANALRLVDRVRDAIAAGLGGSNRADDSAFGR